jgi:hypothetical protein
MVRRESEQRTAGLDGRGGAVHWLASAILFVLLWAGLAPAQASLGTTAGVTSDFTGQRDVAPSRSQVEADLPDLVDTAHPCQIDSDSAVPRHPGIDAFPGSTPCIPIRQAAGLSTPARAFNPRAPPSLR